MSKANVFTVNQRILDLQSRVLALETANKQLIQWVEGALSTKINDAKNIIQDSIRIPADGKDGVDGVSITGQPGAKGDRGDCTIPNDSEVAAALHAIRQKHARCLAMLQAALEANGKRKHSGTKAVLDAELKTIEASLR
jgi:hypothetical protein